MQINHIPQNRRYRAGFTLMETVVAIGIVAILLSAFLTVMTPAAQGIRKSVGTQQADRLTSTLEQELVTVRKGQTKTGSTTAFTNGFSKGFDWLLNSNNPATAIFVYQYRGDLSALREDGTPEPMSNASGQPGADYTTQSIIRRADDPLLADDLEALTGQIFFVKPTQLVFAVDSNDSTKKILTFVEDKDGKAEPGIIKNRLQSNPEVTRLADYTEGSIIFAADFHTLPSKSMSYIQSNNFTTNRFTTQKKPAFSRNLSIRR